METRTEIDTPERLGGSPVRRPLAAMLGTAVTIVLVLAATIDLAAHLTSGSPLWPLARTSDDVSEADKQLRQQAFDNMAPLPLAFVIDFERRKAVGTMNLPAEERDALAPIDSDAGTTAKRAAEPSPTPNLRARAARSVPPRLAWLTLWDTDVEDGDVVRIDSGGYSRTVTLTKAPITFAIPAPTNGVVNVTGVSDGDGGGVTVGLASGASKAVFPVMSVGQVLGLRVRLEP